MGLALMAFMAPELLAMEDFEELITHLKVRQGHQSSETEYAKKISSRWG
jgi:hypothetical protein